MPKLDLTKPEHRKLYAEAETALREWEAEEKLDAECRQIMAEMRAAFPLHGPCSLPIETIAHYATSDPGDLVAEVKALAKARVQAEALR